jgi:membrane-bound lytic murein transglycosylase A
MRTIVWMVGFSSVALAQNLQPVATPPLGAACDDLETAPLAEALDREAATMQKMSGALQIGGRAVPYAEYARTTIAPLAQLARQGAAALCAALPSKFAFYRNAGVGPGHFTVYYNPIIKASRTKHGAFQYALYKKPTGDLAKLTTEQVLTGGLDGKGFELVWMEDPAIVNAVHVEGSATVQLDDGTTISIGADGNNGLPYTNISKLLLADGKIPKNYNAKPGMNKTRSYFSEHKDLLFEYWKKNPHWVWFKEKKGAAAGGKFGELTGGRSLAVDPAFVPLGAAVWIRTDKPTFGPDGKVASFASYGRVALGQDTGAGIKGAGRVDVFYGSGDYAQQAAQVTGRPGEIYVLLAK